MKQSTTPTMRFLIIDTSENTSEEFINLLDEKEILVSANRISGKAQLIEALKTGVWDFLLLNEEVVDIDTNECVSCIKEYKQNTALLLLTSREIDINEMTNAHNLGIAALVSLSFADYSIMTIEREYSALQDQRTKNNLLQENKELEERSQLLLSSSQEAVAYIHQGMHVYANEAYLEKFKFSDLDDAICTPFIDVANVEGRTELKEFLNDIQRQYDEDELDQDTSMEFNTSALCLDDSQFDARLLFKPTQYDGESCLQVFVNDLAIEAEILAEIETKTEPEKEAVTEVDSKLEVQIEAIEQLETIDQVVPIDQSLIEPIEQKIEQPKLEVQNEQEVIAESRPDEIQRIGVLEDVADTTTSNLEIGVEYEPIIAVDDIEVKFYDVKAMHVEESLETKQIDRLGIESTVNILKQQLVQGQSSKAIYTVTDEAIQDAQFPAWLGSFMNGCELGQEGIAVNVPQDVALKQKVEACRMINDLHEQGIKVCISDLKDNQEIIEIISQHKVEFVKLAGTTHEQYIKDKASWMRLGEIIRDLHENNVEVIASNVQSSPILSAFWSAGADMVQGDYFQKGAMEFKAESFVAQIAM